MRFSDRTQDLQANCALLEPQLEANWDNSWKRIGITLVTWNNARLLCVGNSVKPWLFIFCQQNWSLGSAHVFTTYSLTIVETDTAWLVDIYM